MIIIVSSKRKKILANLLESPKEVLARFSYQEKLAVNGRETGLTPEDLCSPGGCTTKKQLLRQAAVLVALSRATQPHDPLTRYVGGLGNDFSYRLTAQVGKIVSRLSGGKRPFEGGNISTLYNKRANEYVVVDKNNHVLRRLINLGVVYAIPEDTFFGHSPEDFNNYWIKVDEAGCWRLAESLIEQEVRRLGA